MINRFADADNIHAVAGLKRATEHGAMESTLDSVRFWANYEGDKDVRLDRIQSDLLRLDKTLADIAADAAAKTAELEAEND